MWTAYTVGVRSSVVSVRKAGRAQRATESSAILDVPSTVSVTTELAPANLAGMAGTVRWVRMAIGRIAIALCDV